MFGLFKLASRNVFRHRGRTLMTLASIVLGVAALILAGGFIEDTIVETGESMIRSSTGHLQVTRQGYWQYGARSPEKYLMENPETLRRELVVAPGVDDVMLRIGFSGLLGNGRTDWAIVGEGVEPAREKRLASYITVVAGRRLIDGDAFGMMIGQGVAKALKLKPGDPVTLLVSTAGGATNLLEFQVTGVFQTFSKDYDARVVRIPLAAAQELLATPGAHTAVVLLKNTVDTNRVARSMYDKLSRQGYEMKTWVELNSFYTQTVTLYRQQFGFLVVIILAMLLMSVSNTVNMGIFERASEFGTMMALGDHSSHVFSLVVIESFWLGLLGALGGVVVGIALAKAISLVGIPMPPPPNADQGYISHILVVPKVVVLSFIVGVVAAVLASLKPARTISRKPIAEALREGV
ncbi:ABC transporter permease [Rugosibacter aromaticivorans]|uniref:ABC transporter permease n=2 Tax=Rugosibacter aromaticivorans TaxID=1565605 RepID=A0A0C5JN34_9PROT|nr:ABC transporter permease [Rugosibacter aromaticivorans]